MPSQRCRSGECNHKMRIELRTCPRRTSLRFPNPIQEPSLWGFLISRHLLLITIPEPGTRRSVHSIWTALSRWTVWRRSSSSSKALHTHEQHSRRRVRTHISLYAESSSSAQWKSWPVWTIWLRCRKSCNGRGSLNIAAHPSRTSRYPFSIHTLLSSGTAIRHL